jgi:arsenate reductase (thioredoxin)
MNEPVGIGQASLQSEIDRLFEEFRGVFSRETIEKCAQESLARLGKVRVSQYVPVFVYRFTRERLRALVDLEKPLEKESVDVLFVCTRNAGRSQIAAAFLRDLSSGVVGVHSAGTAPARELNPTVVRVMAEVGIDVAREFPKPLVDEVVQVADVIVTMGCGDACPVYPFKRYADWEIADPEGLPIEGVRQVRDEIHERVKLLLESLNLRCSV